MKARVVITRFMIPALLLSLAMLQVRCDNDDLWTSASQPAQKELLLDLALIPKYTVTVNVTSYISTFQLQNGFDTLTITGPGMYPFFPLFNGAPYNVQVSVQPTPSGTCTVTGGSGTINNTDVLVIVNCI